MPVAGSTLPPESSSQRWCCARDRKCAAARGVSHGRGSRSALRDNCDSQKSHEVRVGYEFCRSNGGQLRKLAADPTSSLRICDCGDGCGDSASLPLRCSVWTHSAFCGFPARNYPGRRARRFRTWRLSDASFVGIGCWFLLDFDECLWNQPQSGDRWSRPFLRSRNRHQWLEQTLPPSRVPAIGIREGRGGSTRDDRGN